MPRSLASKPHYYNPHEKTLKKLAKTQAPWPLGPSAILNDSADIRVYLDRSVKKRPFQSLYAETGRMRDPDQRFHWFLYLIIVAQFIIIAILLGAYSNEYLANQYQQAWVQQNAPSLQLLLNGNLDAMLIGAAAGLTFLLIRYRRDAGRTIRTG
jgi:hypothetical protein